MQRRVDSYRADDTCEAHRTVECERLVGGLTGGARRQTQSLHLDMRRHAGSDVERGALVDGRANAASSWARVGRQERARVSRD